MFSQLTFPQLDAHLKLRKIKQYPQRFGRF